MKLTSGVDFTNIVDAVFMQADPKSAIKYSQVLSLFALLGSVHVKAARKMLT